MDFTKGDVVKVGLNHWLRAAARSGESSMWKRIDVRTLIFLSLAAGGLVAALMDVVFTSTPTASAESKRDPKQVAAFKRTHPCPATNRTTGACKNYVVDHLVPLCWNGKDAPENMTWQTVADAKKKDVFEKEACAMKRKLEAK